MSTDTLPLFIAARDRAMQQVAANAGENFSRDAMLFMVRYLREHGETPAETLTEACKEAGIRPRNDDRAFGPVYMALMKDGIIEKCGTCLRRRGHGTSGGNVWRIRP